MKNRIRKLQFLLPLNRNGLTSFLSPILGQYGVRNSDFIEAVVADINKHTDNRLAEDMEVEDYDAGLCDFPLIITVALEVEKSGKFELTVDLPPGAQLFRASRKRRGALRNNIKFAKIMILKTGMIENSTDFKSARYSLLKRRRPRGRPKTRIFPIHATNLLNPKQPKAKKNEETAPK